VSEARPVTFLTGASSGLGWALAPLLAADGHALALAARRLDLVEKLAGEIRAGGGVALALEVDVGDREAVRAAVARAEQELGPIERLVANAGIDGPTPARRFDAAVFESVQRTNLLGPAYCIEAVLPGMIARGHGQIVGISSLASYRGLPGGGAYCASKAGLSALLESLRIDLEGSGVAVTTVNPGFVRTPITSRSLHPMPFMLEADDAVRRIHRAIRARRRIFAFPWPLATLTRLARLIPSPFYDRVLAAIAARGGRSGG
jgi:NAD(P)-dependent dehydrogenase (short-subunit alcohol dehydrogenase family)